MSVAVCPPCRIKPDETPLLVNPAPPMLTPETLIDALPELVRVTPKVLELPTATLLKFKLDVLAVRVEAVGGALTVRTAALLVAAPAELPTVTVNCVPVAEVVSAGVV